MKRVISLILAIVMIALLAPMAISADEIKTIDASAPADAEKVKADEVTITKKYFAVSYTMNYAAKAGKEGNNGCNGIILGGSDAVGCVFLPYDGKADGQKTASGKLKFGPWWNKDAFGKDAGETGLLHYVGQDVTVTLVGSYENKKLTVKAYLNGSSVRAWTKDEYVIDNFNGQLGWATKLAGQKATFKFVESDKALDKTALGEKAAAPVTIKTGANVGAWTVEGKNYKTTDFISNIDANMYILGMSDDFELTLKFNPTKECGLFICGNDLNRDGKLYEGTDQYMLLQTNGGGIRLVTSDRRWGSDGKGWNDMLLVGTNGEYDLKVVYKEGMLKLYVNGEKKVETEVAREFRFGNLVGLWSKSNEIVYQNVEFKANTVIVPPVTNPPVINPPVTNPPQTGETTAIVAVIAVLTLAGATIAAKKRH